MIEIEHLLQLWSFTSKVSAQEYMEACAKVARDPNLPPRGPEGSPDNVRRVELMLLWLIEELKQIIDHKTR